jgi:hypothetical protein
MGDITEWIAEDLPLLTPGEARALLRAIERLIRALEL